VVGGWCIAHLLRHALIHNYASAAHHVVVELRKRRMCIQTSLKNESMTERKSLEDGQHETLPPTATAPPVRPSPAVRRACVIAPFSFLLPPVACFSGNINKPD